MNTPGHSSFSFLLILLSFYSINPASAQMITGTWKGKINRQKVELKIIQNGDSLTGTSYYYESANNYRRYNIKGYFDSNTNSAVWWDDQLLDEKSGRFSVSSPGKIPMLTRADFNCPGGGKITLDGKAVKEEDGSNIKADVHLDKTIHPDFADEWDFIIENYTTGTNDPDIIDSVAAIAKRTNVPSTSPPPVGRETYKTPDIENAVKITVKKNEPVIEKPQPVIKTGEPVKALTIEEKFTARKKVLTKEIPVSGDSVELRFYDYGEIDGDSISLFLNDKLLFQHIRLIGSAYIIKLAVSELKESNELIMVAENLGAIPPNTSYMVALVGEKRYEARLESTEGSSAMIRFVKKLESQ